MPLASSYHEGSLGYTCVERIKLELGDAVSLMPKGWLLKATKSFRPDQKQSRITDIVYMPSFFAVERSMGDKLEYALEDDHFVSMLCDEGFRIHVIHPQQARDSKALFQQMVLKLLDRHELSSSGLTARNVALIGKAST